MRGFSASEDGQDVLNRESGEVQTVLDGGGADVGQHQHIGAIEQSSLDLGLVFIDIESRSEDSFLRQCVGEGDFVDDGSAADVDEDRTRLHEREGRSINEMPRRVIKADRQNDRVRQRESVFQRDLGCGDWRRFERWLRGSGGVENPHVPTDRSPGHRGPDSSGADHE